MLVWSVKDGQRFRIDDARITIRRHNGHTRVVIEAPDEVEIRFDEPKEPLDKQKPAP